jgi:hypothetical protein
MKPPAAATSIVGDMPAGSCIYIFTLIIFRIHKKPIAQLKIPYAST